ncbi:MAG: hypothetical protein DPW18_13025 [Chloroflexi bacterium]|nr:hypothetical protein [Chloroflexota bacterium]
MDARRFGRDGAAVSSIRMKSWRAGKSKVWRGENDITSRAALNALTQRGGREYNKNATTFQTQENPHE